MIGVDQIESWRGLKVLDRDGADLGTFEDVYFDSATGTPLLIEVRSGLLGRKSSIVPIDGAVVGPDYVRVAHLKEAVDRVAGLSGDGVPDAERLGSVGTAYGLVFADRVRLESASDRERNRAEGQAARRRADELESAAREKLAEHSAAHDRAQGASEEAIRAEREAEDARQAALEARSEAERYERS
jgi:hypothetical protein